jgi:molybdenum cofactor cytidylyltransferase
MPFLTSVLLDRLALTFEDSGNDAIVFPATENGEQRKPVIWPRGFFVRLRDLKGREGGKSLLGNTADICIAVPVADDGELQDIDEPVMRRSRMRST